MQVIVFCFVFFKAFSFARQGNFVGSLTHSRGAEPYVTAAGLSFGLNKMRMWKIWLLWVSNAGCNQDETELSAISVWEIVQFKRQQFDGCPRATLAGSELRRSAGFVRSRPREQKHLPQLRLDWAALISDYFFFFMEGGRDSGCGFNN